MAYLRNVTGLMSIKRITGKGVHVLLSPFYALFSTRPKRESGKAILVSLPFFPLIWKKKWKQWQESRIWFDQTQKQRLFRWYPFFVRKTYTLTYPDLEFQFEKTPPECNAIVIHVFYPDVFEQMLTTLQSNGSAAYPMYLTCRQEIRMSVEKILQLYSQKAYLHVMENRGRDIAPFLSLLPVLSADGVTGVLKLHTKKSIHLGDCEHMWLSDILSGLVKGGALEKHFHQLNNNPRIGMIAPHGHVVPMAFYYGDNTEKMLGLVKKWNISSSLLGTSFFVAGSMFFIRLASIEDMLSQPVSLRDFEAESGQTDGTLAHAMERMFSLVVQSGHYWITDSKETKVLHTCTLFSDHVYSR